MNEQSWEEIRKKMEEERVKRDEESRKKCVTLMRRHRLSKVECEFSGSGDSGGIDSTVPFDRSNNRVELPEEALAVFEDRVYEALPGGWEINDGSSGKVVILPNGLVRGGIEWNVITTEYESINGGLPTEEEA